MYKYKRIKDMREDNDLTQQDIANILGIKYQQYQRYENGQYEIPVHQLIKLAAYYNVSIDYLVSKREFE